MVYASFIQGRGTNAVNIPLLLYIINMPVPIYPCFQVIFIQVNASGILAFKDKSIFVCQQIMIENHNRSSGTDMCQIIFQPAADVIGSIAGSMVSTGHRGDNIVHITRIEGVIYRTVIVFKHLFAIFPFYQIMVSNAIEDRTIHIFGIHQFDMSFQALFITDISGMNDESRLFIRCIATETAHPILMILCIEYFSIGYVDILMRTVFANPSAIRHQTKIITSLFLFYFMIITVEGFVARGSRDKNKTLTLMTG